MEIKDGEKFILDTFWSKVGLDSHFVIVEQWEVEQILRKHGFGKATESEGIKKKYFNDSELSIKDNFPKNLWINSRGDCLGVDKVYFSINLVDAVVHARLHGINLLKEALCRCVIIKEGESKNLEIKKEMREIRNELLSQVDTLKKIEAGEEIKIEMSFLIKGSVNSNKLTGGS